MRLRMKKFLSVILFAAVFFSFGVHSFAAGSSEISFVTSGPDENGKVFVDVMISGGEPAMLQFCVAYDSDKLSCVSANAGSVFSGNLAPTINVTEGKIFFVWDSLNPLKTGGTLLRIEFSQKAQGSASVWIDETEDVVIMDENFVDIGVIGRKTDVGSSESSKAESSSAASGTSENSAEESSKAESSGAEKSETQPDPGKSSDSEAENGYSSGIEIEKTQLTVKVGEETAIGISDTEKEVFWYSSNESVVLVEDGKIIPVAPGTATITVITEDGLEEAACVVTVTEGDIQEDSSEGESSPEVIEANSPRKEKEDSVPLWAWTTIAVLGAGVICSVVFLIKKGKR